MEQVNTEAIVRGKLRLFLTGALARLAFFPSLREPANNRVKDRGQKNAEEGHA